MTLLRKFLRDRRGATAIEFALIAPLLSTVIIAGWDGWLLYRQANSMHDAVQTGARYYQVGGGDDAQAKTAALAAWKLPPSDANVSVNRVCKCGSSTISCTDTCSTGVQMSTFVTVGASGTFDGALIHRSIAESAVTRVQ